jgi:hypothetical protein
MATQPIDYDAIAKQHGAVSSGVDYDAIAKQHGAVSSEAAPAGPGAVERFLAPLDPRPLAHALFKPSDDPKEDPRSTFAKNLRDIAANVANGSLDQAHAAVEAFKSGDYTSALGHALYSAPVVGPIANKAAEDFKSGNVAGGLGGVTAIAAPEIVGKVAPLAIDGARAAAPIVADAAKTAAAKIVNSVHPEVAGAAGALAGAGAGYEAFGGHGATAGALIGRTAAKSFLEKLKSSLAPSPEAAPAAAPAPRIIAGETPPPERAAWRQGLVNELNQDAGRAGSLDPVPQRLTLSDLANPAKPAAAARSIANMSDELNASLKETMPEITVKPTKDFVGPARAAKAKQLAEFLHSGGNGIPYDAAVRMNPEQWKMAAEGAGLKTAASADTIKLALSMLNFAQMAK